ncbi:HK97-gp10 family putative phage morphogenesis protein [Myroides odoratimimus]|uniref:HK97-gp10 family putative phage morphogenesis protein n=1 Tax=Myroides odoratimimus TaxID=76832 RepID=UPI002576212F|nr:HK97-gp10 family putative phage morphogenesis protein [Myroides odoratimimus]MDM1057871.1 HK97 gp10 family phage protein [Myroides odoratimimus]
MSNSVRVDISGFEELNSRIKELGDDKDKRKESLAILRQIAKPTVTAAQSIVPVSKQRHYSRGKWITPGTLKKSLGVINVRGENPVVAVGPRAKRKYDGWYGAFVHEGHEYFVGASSSGRGGFSMIRRARSLNLRRGTAKNKKRKTKKERARLRSIGRAKMTKPQPFLDKAYEQTKGKVTQDAERQFASFIQRRINRLSR